MISKFIEERLWWKIEGLINGLFNARRMNRYHKFAKVVKGRIDKGLKEKGIEYDTSIRDTSELDWPKLTIQVFIKVEDYDEVLELWNWLCKIGYNNLTNEEIRGIFISVDRMRRMEVNEKM